MGMFSSEKFENLEDLLLHELKDLYDAEHRIADALPKMAERAESKELKQAFNTHLAETRGQIERLERVFNMLDQKAERSTCDAMKGLISEGEHVLSAKGNASVIDAALIAAAQRVEHYEMAGYGSARSFAQRCGLQDVADLLQQTLDEEGETDKKLTSIADGSVNISASRTGRGESVDRRM